jgi:hypothetical protein
MPNSDRSVIDFTQEVRTVAARTIVYYRQMKRVIQEAKALGLLSMIPDDPDIIEDDVTPVVTNAQVRDVVDEATAFVEDMEANDNEKLEKNILIAGFVDSY